jgi:hypothetical protein
MTVAPVKAGWRVLVGVLALGPQPAVAELAESAESRPVPTPAARSTVVWTGPADARPEGLGCLDVDHDGDDDVVVVGARGLWVVAPRADAGSATHLSWPPEAPAAPAVRDPHASVLGVPEMMGGGLMVAPSSRAGFGQLKPAVASRGAPAWTSWVIGGPSPVATDGEQVLTGQRAPGTHHLVGLRLGETTLRNLPSPVRAAVLLRGEERQRYLAVAGPDGITVVQVQGARTGRLILAPNLAPPLLAADTDGDGVDELWSARDTADGHDALLVSRVGKDGLTTDRRLDDLGGRLQALSTCPGSRRDSLMVLVRGKTQWSVLDVRP